VRVFLDTSVLVAACLSKHPHHARARPVLERIVRAEDTGVAAAHSLGECYSAFTTIPLDPRIQPIEAERLIEHNVVAHFQLIEAEPPDYQEAIRRCASQSAIGGMVVDALLLECARKAGADRIYTFNTRRFQALAADLAGIVCAP
jgi:predicted nucleic acid-binding protein